MVAVTAQGAVAEPMGMVTISSRTSDSDSCRPV